MNENRAQFATGGHFLIVPLGSEAVFSREQFTDDQREIKGMVEDFARERIRPNRPALDEFSKDLSLRLLREMGGLGLLGIDVPEAYGGMELDKITSAIVAEAVSSGQCPSFAATHGVQTGIGCLPLVWFGTEEQKKRYLPKLVTGEKIGAYSLTEPSAGSDALSAKTTAVLSEDGRHYLLNGEKIFATNGGWADVYTVFAKVAGAKLCAFIVDRDTPGLEVGPEEHKMGMKGSSTAPLTFSDAKVPAENLLDGLGKGGEIALNVLNWGRLKLAAADLGGSKVDLEEAVKYAMGRRQFGQSIAQFDVIKGKVADMVIRIYTADSMVYRTIGLIQQAIESLDKSASDYYVQMGEATERYAIEASMAKVYGSETLGLITDQGIQILGGYGFIEEYPMARAYRDARIDRIWEGTNEINRQIIAGYMLKKALLEELPIRAAIDEIPEFLASHAEHKPEGLLGAEVRAIETGKRLALSLFHEAVNEFGQDLMHEQQLTGILADMFIDLYTAESTLCRVQQLGEATTWRDVPTDIAKVHAAEVSLRLLGLALTGLNGIYRGSPPPEVHDYLHRFQKRMLLNSDIIQLKRDIADYVYTESRYPF
ncbi:MAG: acyl-CoA dehydrogenase family protein [Gammaproteobacteria bacterium]|nr:acyl-CoA dehydrogenase family protein [Gammaproteobacteria bacterium]MDJ0890404.1 acyl-CoA dehydrogenase family protein [Gammaproteobacteria bacterium]